MEITNMGHGVYRVVAQYGFMESPDIPQIMSGIRTKVPNINLDEPTYYVVPDKPRVRAQENCATLAQVCLRLCFAIRSADPPDSQHTALEGHGDRGPNALLNR